MSLWSNEVNPTNSSATIVFLHGLGVSSWMWQTQLAALSQHYRCLTIDLPGNGESQQDEWRSLQNAAEEVAEVIRQRAPEGRAHVVGLSLGGYVALSLLAHQPDAVESVLVSGVNVRPFARQWLWRTSVALTVPLMNWSPLIKANAKAMQLPAEAVPLMKRDMRRLSRTTILRTYEEILNFSLLAELHARTQRVLAVAGNQEAQTVRDGLTEFPKLLPNGQAALVPNAHHGWNGEHPQLFNEMVQRWVQNKPLPEALMAVQ